METDALQTSWNGTGRFIEARWVRAPQKRDLLAGLARLEKVVQQQQATLVLEHVEDWEAQLHEHGRWLAANWVPHLANVGVRRLAVVMSKATFSKLSLKQSVVRDPERSFVRHCFSDEASALRWFERQQDLLSAGVSSSRFRALAHP